MTSIIILQHCYGNTTEILRKYYDCTTGLQTTGYYRPLRVTMINTVTTGFVGKSHGLLMVSDAGNVGLYKIQLAYYLLFRVSYCSFLCHQHYIITFLLWPRIFYSASQLITEVET